MSDLGATKDYNVNIEVDVDPVNSYPLLILAAVKGNVEVIKKMLENPTTDINI